MVKDNFGPTDDFTNVEENAIAAAVNLLMNLDRIPDCLQSLPRSLTSSDVPTAASSLHLAYCTAPSNFNASTIHTYCGSVAASGLTKCRFGIYSVAENGDLTLVASTPNDTTLFGSTFNGVSKGLSVSVDIVESDIYVVAGLFIGSQIPNIGGAFVNQAEAAVPPMLNGIIGSISDLPSTVDAGDIDQDYRIPYFRAA